MSKTYTYDPFQPRWTKEVFEEERRFYRRAENHGFGRSVAEKAHERANSTAALELHDWFDDEEREDLESDLLGESLGYESQWVLPNYTFHVQ